MTTSNLRAIDIAPYAAKGTSFGQGAGERPKLEWVAISKLRVDMDYQREIGQRGRKTVIAIAMNFNWASFEAATVAPIAGGLFAIINGQHRVTAALLCSIKEVPCLIVKADKAQQAASFAEINTQITAVTPMQLHAARLAAGNGPARELERACKEAGVTICRYPVPAANMKPGETLAVGKLISAMRRFGRDVLVKGLTCIASNTTAVGMVRAPVIEAVCSVLESEGDWLKHKRLVPVMGQLDIPKAYTEAGKASFAERCSITSKLVDIVSAHLEKRLA